MTDTSQPTKVPRLPTLTGMRFAAALLVFCTHVSLEGFFADAGAADTASFLVKRAGWAGVGFFFVLSGFVLAWSARPGDTTVGFWRRRAVKIYPNHVLTWAIAFALLLWTGKTVTAGVAIPNLLLVHTWLPIVQNFASMNTVAWSLCCEAFFYLLFPWLLAAVNRIRAERLWAATIAVIAVIVVLPLIAQLLPDRPRVPFAPDVPVYQFWFVYLFPPVRTLDFLLGILLAKLLLSGRRAPLSLAPATGLAVLGYVGLLYAPYLFALDAVTIVPIALLILAGARADVRGTPSLWRARFVVWLGDISFAFYMIHELVLHYRVRLFGIQAAWSTPVALAVVLGLLVVDVLLAWGLYSAVESPIVRRWSRPRRRESSLPAVSTATLTSLAGVAADTGRSADAAGARGGAAAPSIAVVDSPAAVSDSPVAEIDSPPAVVDSPVAVLDSPAVPDSPAAVLDPPAAVRESPAVDGVER
ncbi:acyltransferase family protein [Nocardia cerradoensis]|uniref:acyltransferase family protein n=1 Tax=Nocardia cerradoensis TaxID=85688 RepID=UPI0003137EE2|nr:acyltransferase [Nocardia cerradoensis]